MCSEASLPVFLAPLTANYVQEPYLSLYGLHFYYSILSISLIQELTSTLNHSYLSLVNSGTPCLLLYFLLPIT
ncbi:hypothetical protein E2C01_008216 [Portunus trituberculatus]|uniref:Uncharacterized protein n=1 Tax=Portunus trituberculatus TaxID=210409 RepID=A0A5B7D3C3_PORTR|nr:hypothetical protein [Portunus trituberculatus]